MTQELIAVISLLEGALYQETKNLWDLCAERYGAKEVQLFQHPSFTFQGGSVEATKLPEMRKQFQRFAAKVKPFTLSVRKMGNAGKEMLYFEVERTEELAGTHLMANAFLDIFCDRTIEEYLPERWHPHVAIAMHDLSERGFAELWEDFGAVTYAFDQVINNLMLIRFLPDGSIEVLEKAKLSI
ncbi:MAG TPA: hypothetical protein P5077_11060 [bacterium]|nr:hypothetical protein [bacterium]